MSDSGANRLSVQATLLELQPLRHTPAGVPVAACVLKHASTQIEAGLPREVVMELQAVALGDLAAVLAAARPGMVMQASGFLAAKNMRSRVPVLHLNKIEFLEGMNHGFQVEVEIQEKG